MTKIRLTLFFTVLVITHLIWDHFNGGIPVHHIMADERLPGISNWWGLITIPSFAWVMLSILEKNGAFNSRQSTMFKRVKIGFILSLSFGIINAVLWQLGLDHILQYFIFLPVLLSLVLKVYRPECMIGFVIGMMITFGGVLPIGFGLILMVLSFLTYNIIHRGFIFFIQKINN